MCSNKATMDGLIAAAVHTMQTAIADFAPVAFANSMGAEDMVLTDLIYRNHLEVDIFTIDTGRLPQETYSLMAASATHYGRTTKIYMPVATSVEAFVEGHGINGFLNSIDARKACCHARKVEPLRRALAGKRAWITGLRSGQASTREAVLSSAFDQGNGLQKVNPLAQWTDADVWTYLRSHNVPYNTLHDQGYPSIGCAPCTRAIQPGEDIRAGRWWWENPETKECGLHMVDGRLQRINAGTNK
jgi:phosphoadenosine phosphosulfate reductase